jgi:hypothetical protein
MESAPINDWGQEEISRLKEQIKSNEKYIEEIEYRLGAGSISESGEQELRDRVATYKDTIARAKIEIKKFGGEVEE